MKKLLIFAMSALVLGACSSDKDDDVSNGGNNGNPDSQGRVALQISGGIDVKVTSNAKTRAYDDSWTASDAIGVYALTHEDTPSSYSIITAGGTNVAYTADAAANTNNGSTFQSFTATTPLYLPTDGSRIDVYAYYPRQESPTPTGQTVTFTTQDSTALDWMITGQTQYTTRTGSTTITKANNSCQLLFAHKFCKLQFNIVHGTGLTATNITGGSPSLTIADMPSSAKLHLFSGAVSDVSGTLNTITAQKIEPCHTSYDAAFSAIIPPHTTAAVRTVTLTINTVNYTFTIPANYTFASGNRYIWNVTVNSNGLTVTAAITNWTDVTVDGNVVVQ